MLSDVPLKVKRPPRENMTPLMPLVPYDDILKICAIYGMICAITGWRLGDMRPSEQH